MPIKKNTRCKWFSDYYCLNTKICEVENKIPNTSCLVSTNILNTKISEVENRILDNLKYITTQKINKLTQASAYENQGHATTTRFVTKFEAI